MSWLPLAHFRDASVPKLDNLRRAAAAGLRVPPTWWQAAHSLDPASPPPLPDELGPGPFILRSGSPTEDKRTTSNAGQLLSLIVAERAAYADSLRRVIAVLPTGADGQRLGVVFLQPVVRGSEAGVAFCDGFYYERTRSHGALNVSLTAGQARGEVTRALFQRGDPWSEWLAGVYEVFGAPRGDQRIDLEFTRDESGFVLLQVRPALFPLLRNHAITLANHKETLGDLPSPWMVSAFIEAGKNLSFLTSIEPALETWDEVYAIEVAERAWLNLGLWFRWMDHFGLPRALVSEGLGGDTTPETDRRYILSRFFRMLPRVLRLQGASLVRMGQAPGVVAQIEDAIARATTLDELFAATVVGFRLALNTNFAIGAVCSGSVKLRRLFFLPTSARVVTADMMEEYQRLGNISDPVQRERGLDAWLLRYGHRGPFESDLARPRFVEMRAVLRADLANLPGGETPPRSGGWLARLARGLFRPLYWPDERREWFRDTVMRAWLKLRRKLLAQAERLKTEGRLESVDDVFWLRGGDLEGDLRERVKEGKARHERVRGVYLPTSGFREAIEQHLREAGPRASGVEGQRIFPGIALGPKTFAGVVRKADDLLTLLKEAGQIGPKTVLVVPTLEPSWAVLFPRVGGVVAELGGELSHASILLREAGKPALVNVVGIWQAVRDGQQVRLDGQRGVVEVLG